MSVQFSASSPSSELMRKDAPPASLATLDLADADWRFLLPRLSYRRILYVGVPEPGTAAALRGMAPHTVILTHDRAVAARLAADGDRLQVVCADTPVLPDAPAGFDLAVVSAGEDGERLLRQPAWLADVRRLLADDGVVLVETSHRATSAGLARIDADAAALGFLPPDVQWAARRKGMLRVAVPLARPETRKLCLTDVVSGVSRRGRALLRAARSLERFGALDYLVPRRLLLLERSEQRTGQAGVGGYVLDRVRAAGVQLDDPHVAFYARANGVANKVTFLVFDGTALKLVVKLTRNPHYNWRLEAEHRALEALSASGAAPAGTYPEPVFLDYHHDLAVVGQTAVHGAAFRNVARPTPDCRITQAALSWIAALGHASTAPRADGADTRAWLGDLHQRCRESFPLTPDERAFLAEQLDRLATGASRLPTVFQHGDAGSWNAVVDHGGRVAFLDWEDGVAAGMPLWDLFCFVQDLGSWAARLHGVRDGAGASAAALGGDTPYSRLLVRATREYCERVGVPRELVEPLFYVNWVDRAVRAMPRARVPIEETKFFRLLRLTMAGRNQPGLRWLFE